MLLLRDGFCNDLFSDAVRNGYCPFVLGPS